MPGAFGFGLVVAVVVFGFGLVVVVADAQAGTASIAVASEPDSRIIGQPGLIVDHALCSPLHYCDT